MINILKGFNDQKGRFNRFEFWVGIILMLLIILVLSLSISFLSVVLDMYFLGKLAGLLSGLGSLYIIFTGYIKRLHDLNKSGWFSLLLFIPFINLGLLIYCGFFQGTKGINKYDTDLNMKDNHPKKKKKSKEKTIEL